jgi:hypothetical protein
MNRDSLLSLTKTVTKPTTTAMKKFRLITFIDGALAQNKLLKVNDQGQGGGGNNTRLLLMTEAAVKKAINQLLLK